MAFRLKCRNKLYKNLGQYDAICEFIEVAIRDFISNEDCIKNFDTFLEAKSSLHKIRVNTVEQSIYRSRISQSYIFSVFQSFELFLKEFKEEYSELYGNKLQLPENSISLLQKIIQKVSSMGKAKSLIGEYKLELFEYYRDIRNKYAHEYIKEEKLEKSFKEINKYKYEIQKEYNNLNAPNTYHNISFDDFILFSRIVKDIANGLCELVTPQEEVFKNYYLGIKQFNKFNEKPKRKRNAIKQDLIYNFGKIENLENILIEIVPLA